MKVQACLFDIGNVLVTFDYARTFPALAAQTSQTFAEIHAHLSGMTEALETGRLASEKFIARAMEFIGERVTRAAFLECFTGIFEPIPAAWAAVDRVRASVPVYLFSNTSELHETSLRRDFPDFSKFTGDFNSWRLGAMKPAPGMYQAALATLGLRGEEIAYVDDLAANIAAGRSFGFRSHQYDRTRHDELLTFLDECGL